MRGGSSKGLYFRREDLPADEAVRDRVPSLDLAVIGSGGGVNLVLKGTPVYATHSRVSEGFSRVLGVSPARGRWFTEQEHGPAAEGPDPIIVSYGYAQSRYGGDAAALGSNLTVDGRPAQIVGVMPAGFRFLDKLFEHVNPPSSCAGNPGCHSFDRRDVIENMVAVQDATQLLVHQAFLACWR